MRIDSHQHFWTRARGDYGWLTPQLAQIYRDFDPHDLVPLLGRHNIERTILVQAAPTVAETQFMLAIAARTPFVAGVVGWVDFEAKNAPDVIAELASDQLLVGLRPMVHDIADDDWLLRSDLTPAFAALKSHRLVFDALVRPRHLPRLLALIEQHPDLPIVVDHAGKPFIRERKLDPWWADITVIAAHPHIVCKMSGLVTEAAANWTVDDLKPYVTHLLETFGPQRLLWGSDWPVVDLAGGYDRWCEATMALLRDLSDSDREAIFGNNAACVYLKERGRSSC
jgi:L-fuconolactonase